jgi:hypothetical protein
MVNSSAESNGAIDWLGVGEATGIGVGEATGIGAGEAAGVGVGNALEVRAGFPPQPARTSDKKNEKRTDDQHARLQTSDCMNPE